MAKELKISERRQIAEILNRRANEIASYSMTYKQSDNHFGSVEFALSREMQRLRRLADKISPPDDDEDDDE